MPQASIPVTSEDAARYDAADRARALRVAGDRAVAGAPGLRVRGANGREMDVADGQWVVRYGPGDVGVMDDGEYRRFFGG